jgi:hypothetical protein
LQPARQRLAASIYLARQHNDKQRRRTMGEKGGKKDKNKADKQKQEQNEKKKQQQKTKLPAKKPA